MIEKSLSEVQAQIESGDLLLFRGAGWISRLIGTAGRTNYTHCGKADWWDEILYICEVREFKGGRIVTLGSQVAKYPGRIDVYQANAINNPNYNRQAASLYMRRFAGCAYGWWSVMAATLLHLPFVRFLVHVDYTLESEATDEGPGKPPYCSQAVSMADIIGGGVDPVPNLPSRLTEPGDLARSSFYDYRFTLSGL